MRTVHLTLPMRYKGDMVRCGYDQGSFYLGARGNIYYFVISNKVTLAIVGAAIIYLIAQFVPGYQNNVPTLQASAATSFAEVSHKAPNSDTNDVLGLILDEFEDLKSTSLATAKDSREKFTVQKQLILSRFLIESKVSRTDQLSDEKLLDLNREVSELFIKEMMIDPSIPKHVYQFFAAEYPLRKIETALMEQTKYHVPASITLAQAALETGYGNRVINNNFFGIKDKDKQTTPIYTTEYYTHRELQYNQHKVVSSSEVLKGGRKLYKCLVKDSFASYKTPWESFRSHSIFLNQSKRYSPLFTNGRDYKAWAEKIGSTKYGGVGYATSPIYGELLKKIIKRYNLDLLDY
ncbi:glucosaminidase domain-containing protein [Limibacter armeniacum]|uniref:glycoside hydrolase family 73 protein n=1 Tax=Limibacter armeniacum TaxID=466084 RepID=UPI002FE5CDBD